jgi:phosphate starvation-inducible PhoH-like protein
MPRSKSQYPKLYQAVELTEPLSRVNHFSSGCGMNLAFAFAGKGMIGRERKLEPDRTVNWRKIIAPEINHVETKSHSRRIRLSFSDLDAARQLFGDQNRNLKTIANAFRVLIDTRGDTVLVEGTDIETALAKNVLNQLYELIREQYPIYPQDIDYAIKLISSDDRVRLKDIFLDKVFITAKKKAITPKSIGQKEYIDAIRNHDIVFGIGPAGTGKTYLAMAMAVSALSKGLVDRIILTRPAVEAGEALGFLPGDLAEKVDPYLRPLYDALHDMMRFEKVTALMHQGIIEVAPIAFMRGRTLNDSFIILDEAQNTTSEQMKMFLTRIGFSSKAVITGDITQVDLPSEKSSGLIESKEILKDIKGIKFTFFSERDVVRHKLVQEIIRAYDRRDDMQKDSRGLTPIADTDT